MIQFGMTRAENREKPNTKIFLEEFMSTYCEEEKVIKTTPSTKQQKKKSTFFWFTWRLEIPAAVMTPNMMMNIPPITGVGIVAKTAPILPKTPIKIMKMPLSRITVRLPTCRPTNKTLSTQICPKKDSDGL